MTSCTSTLAAEELPLKPLFARVLIKRQVEEKVGSIIIANAKAKAPSVGKVISVGPTCDESIKPGMTVMFGKYAGVWLDENGSQLDRETAEKQKGWFLCADEDILGILRE